MVQNKEEGQSLARLFLVISRRGAVFRTRFRAGRRRIAYPRCGIRRCRRCPLRSSYPARGPSASRWQKKRISGRSKKSVTFCSNLIDLMGWIMLITHSEWGFFPPGFRGLLVPVKPDGTTGFCIHLIYTPSGCNHGGQVTNHE